MIRVERLRNDFIVEEGVYANILVLTDGENSVEVLIPDSSLEAFVEAFGGRLESFVNPANSVKAPSKPKKKADKKKPVVPRQGVQFQEEKVAATQVEDDDDSWFEVDGDLDGGTGP